MWLAPFHPGRPAMVRLALPRGCGVPSRLRLWNYNASRAHTTRGARKVEVRLGGERLRAVELRQASGIVAGAVDHATVLDFTEDPEVPFSAV